MKLQDMDKMGKLLMRGVSQVIELLYPERKYIKRKVYSWSKRDIYEHVSSSISALPDIEGLYCGQYRYEALKQLIWGAKYHNDQDATIFCAQLLADEVVAWVTDRMYFEPIVLATVPSTAYSLGKRPVDHMNEMVNIMKSFLTDFLIPNFQTSILSISPTHPCVQQSKAINRSQRINSARNKFQVDIDITGKHVLLIDDVVTTGATMKDCIRALQMAGAVHIYCMSLAH